MDALTPIYLSKILKAKSCIPQVDSTKMFIVIKLLPAKNIMIFELH